MLLDIVTAGTTDYSCTIRILDTSDGTVETGVVHNTSGIDLWYRRQGGAVVPITEVETGSSPNALTDAHTDGGFLHIRDGYYRLDLPDAAVAAGVDYVDIGGTVTGMQVIAGRIRIISATRGLAGTALPNAAADAAGGLPISDAGGVDVDALAAAITLLNGTKIPDTLSLSNINAQVVDVLRTDTNTQPAQGAPPATPTLAQAILYLYIEYVRNKVVIDTDTADQKQIFADDGSTILYEKDLTNASNVTTIAEATTGA